MPNSVLPGLGQKNPLSSPHLPCPPTLPSLPPPLSLPSIILATFSTIQWALTKKLSALSEPASASDWELSHTPSIRWKQRDVWIEFPGCGRSCPCHTQSCFGFFGFTPRSLSSSKALNEIIYSVAFALSSSPRFLTHHADPSHPPPPPSPSWGRPLVSERGPRGP